MRKIGMYFCILFLIFISFAATTITKDSICIAIDPGHGEHVSSVT